MVAPIAYSAAPARRIARPSKTRKGGKGRN